MGKGIWWHLWPLLQTWINSAWVSYHMPSKMWDEITYPFPNFNGATTEAWEWISNFISLYNRCDYLSMEGIRLIHVIKKDHRGWNTMYIYGLSLIILVMHHIPYWWNMSTQVPNTDFSLSITKLARDILNKSNYVICIYHLSNNQLPNFLTNLANSMTFEVFAHFKRKLLNTYLVDAFIMKLSKHDQLVVTFCLNIRFTDAGAPSGLSRTNRKVMTTVHGIIYFEHKTEYLLIHAPFTRIVVFWHISNMPL